MKNYRCYDIDWDTDGNEVELPNEMIIEVENDFDVSLDGANILSDKMGWCVNNFSFDEVEDKKFEPLMIDQYESPLVTRVVEEIKEAVRNSDVEAVDELLRFCPRINLIQYLPEDEWEKWMTQKEKKEIYKNT